MTSVLAESLNLSYPPIALVWSDEKPERAVSFAPGKWGCIMFHLAAAAKGKTAVISRETFGCQGGGTGMGFGNCYLDFPGGFDAFCRFLSNGNTGDPAGQAIGAHMAAAGNEAMADEFLHGERYLKNPEAVKRFVAAMPIQDIPARYVILKPLSETDAETENVRCITLLVNPDQLSALVVLANYEHPERENVAIPFGAGCQIFGVYMYRELMSATPRALVGLTDISARKNVRHLLGGNLLSFSMVPSMYQQMQAHVEDSFLQRHNWQTLRNT